VIAGVAVGADAQTLSRALLDDVGRIASRIAVRIQQVLPSCGKVPADALIALTLANTRSLLETVCNTQAEPSAPRTISGSQTRRG
jgi:hypothetical protein